jgi:PIN domain nuclease of toxin-antitoxin system
VNSRYLLDASAVLALIWNEPGADRVRPLLAAAEMTAVNLVEVVKKLRERGVPKEDVDAIVSDLQIPVGGGPGNLEQAVAVGEVAAVGRPFGLSLGDSVCLAMADRSGLTAVTAERRWTEVLPGAKILVIR